MHNPSFARNPTYMYLVYEDPNGPLKLFMRKKVPAAVEASLYLDGLFNFARQMFAFLFRVLLSSLLVKCARDAVR